MCLLVACVVWFNSLNTRNFIAIRYTTCSFSFRAACAWMLREMRASYHVDRRILRDDTHGFDLVGRSSRRFLECINRCQAESSRGFVTDQFRFAKCHMCASCHCTMTLHAVRACEPARIVHPHVK